MRTYCLNIQIKDSTPMIWRSIRISDVLTFRQLHEAILTLFGWKDSEPYRFQMKHQLVSSASEHEVRQHIQTYLYKQSSFIYIYGNPKEEWKLNIQATPVYGFDPYKNEIHLLAHEQNHPPYGIGGIMQYQKMLEEVKNPNSIHFHAIHMILEHTRPPFDEVSIQNGLNAILSDTLSNQLDDVKEKLKQVCKEIQRFTSAMPCLLLIKQQQTTYPCYIEQLDNGIEILIFYDENGFCRSILNSVNGDPDLLFTSSLTIDFLYDEIEESDLLLSDHKHLCFRNQPGYFPAYPKQDDIHLLSMLLQKLYTIFTTQTALPTLAKQQMALVDEQLHLHTMPFVMKEELCSLRFPNDILQELHTLPHTNEQLHLNILALPAKGFMNSKKMDIHIVASGQDYTKEECVHLETMEILIDQLYYFFLSVFHERGLPECIYTNNINLANIIKEMGTSLSIGIVASKSSEVYNESLMDILLSTFQLSEQELSTMDALEQTLNRPPLPFEHIEEEESYTVKPKILN